MKTYTPEELKKILADHAEYLKYPDQYTKKANLEGADLRNANLYGANLQGADLQGAYLQGADLQGAYLRGANLRGANLQRADLEGADLEGADLEGANLRGADLRNANLYGANLRGANLQRADLEGADLEGADLRSANLEGADLRSACGLDESKTDDKTVFGARTIVPEAGALIVFKKLKGRAIATLEIPAEAGRVSAMVSRKCRAEYVKVLKITGPNGEERREGGSEHDHGATVYKVGEIVRPDSFNADPKFECTNGIHFFITKKEAEEYN